MNKFLTIFLILFSFLIAITLVKAQEVALPAAIQQQIIANKAAAEEQKKAGNKSLESYYLNKIAFDFWDHQHLVEAVPYFEESLQLNHKLGNQNAIATIANHLGTLYSDLNNVEKAIEFFQQSLSARQVLKDKLNIASARINLAIALSMQQNYKEATEHLEEGLMLAKELQNLKMIRSCYGMLSENYKQLGDNEKAIAYFNYYASLDKKIQEENMSKLQEESQKQISQIQAEKYAKENELQNKESELHHKQEELQKVEEISRERQMQIDLLFKEKEIKELALKEQEARLKLETLIKNSLMGGFILVGLLVLMLYLNIRQAKKTNKELGEKNDSIQQQKTQISHQRDKLEKAFKNLNESNVKITSSIQYAQRIQQVMLEQETAISTIFSDSFILFIPRDIVSGDFYWFAETEEVAVSHKHQSKNSVALMENQGKKQMVAAVDCTGHGVPGALMSMLGYNFLNEIKSRGFQEPDQILNELHVSVRNTLKQQETENQDGMDVALCVIDPENKKMEFAGANNPIIYFQQGNMHLIKGNRRPIGGYQPEAMRIFDKHVISIQEETTVYIFSDGFQDQFGGDKGQKFRSQNLYSLLQEIHSLPMPKQKDHLYESVKTWMGDRFEQIDDILVMGFKVGGNIY